MTNGGISLLPEDMKKLEQEELGEKPSKEPEKAPSFHIPGTEPQMSQSEDLGPLPAPRPPVSQFTSEAKREAPVAPYKQRLSRPGEPSKPPPPPIPQRRSLQVSLIPEEVKEKKQNIKFRKIALGAVLGIEVACLIVFMLVADGFVEAKRQQIEKIDADIANTKAQIGTMRDENAEIFMAEKKLNAVNYLLGRHAVPSKIFEFLEKNTLSAVWYESYISTGKGELSLSAAADNLETAAKQIAHLEAMPEVKEIRVNNFENRTDLLGRETGVSFEMQIVFVDGFLNAN
ncbi:MAG: hypothetical protein PHW53_03140 [Patescibacteria group bacterium]|nr:hypothetical protein [Patescibacteria group bacterium]